MNRYTELDGHDGLIMLLSEILIAAHNRRETGDADTDSEFVRALRREGLNPTTIAQVLKVLKIFELEC